MIGELLEVGEKIWLRFCDWLLASSYFHRLIRLRGLFTMGLAQFAQLINRHNIPIIRRVARVIFSPTLRSFWGRPPTRRVLSVPQLNVSDVQNTRFWKFRLIGTALRNLTWILKNIFSKKSVKSVMIIISVFFPQNINHNLPCSRRNPSESQYTLI